MSGVPAYAQHTVQEQMVEPQRSFSEGSSRSQKYKLKNGRRPKKDPLPMLTGNEEIDVVRLWEWVGRGAHTPAQRRFTWRNERMDVAEAYRRMQREKRQLRLQRLQEQQQLQQRLGRLNASMVLPKAQYGMPQHADYLQDFGSGYQNPFPQYLQASIPVPQVPFGMPQYVEPLPGQWWDPQQPLPQQLQVSQPAPQYQLGTGDSAEYLPARLQQVDPAAYPPPVPLSVPVANMSRRSSGFSGVTEGLQSQSSSGSLSNLDLNSWGESSQSTLPSESGVTGGLQNQSSSGPMTTMDLCNIEGFDPELLDPFISGVTEGFPGQLSGSNVDMDLFSMGAWTHPTEGTEAFLPPSTEFGGFGALEFTGGAEDLPADSLAMTEEDLQTLVKDPFEY